MSKSRDRFCDVFFTPGFQVSGFAPGFIFYLRMTFFGEKPVCPDGIALNDVSSGERVVVPDGTDQCISQAQVSRPIEFSAALEL